MLVLSPYRTAYCQTAQFVSKVVLPALLYLI
nr:MAG TPA: hypothetical protein [Caudoviricetes sp.]